MGCDLQSRGHRFRDSRAVAHPARKALTRSGRSAPVPGCPGPIGRTEAGDSEGPCVGPLRERRGRRARRVRLTSCGRSLNAGAGGEDRTPDLRYNHRPFTADYRDKTLSERQPKYRLV